MIWDIDVSNRICLRTQHFGCGTLLTLLLSSGLITLHSLARWPHRDARFAALGAGSAHSLLASPPLHGARGLLLQPRGTAVWSWFGTVLSNQANQVFFNFSADLVSPQHASMAYPADGMLSGHDPAYWYLEYQILTAKIAGVGGCGGVGTPPFA